MFALTTSAVVRKYLKSFR